MMIYDEDHDRFLHLVVSVTAKMLAIAGYQNKMKEYMLFLIGAFVKSFFFFLLTTFCTNGINGYANGSDACLFIFWQRIILIQSSTV